MSEDDLVARLRSHATGTTLCPTSRNLTAAAADEITRLRADLAAAREALKELLNWFDKDGSVGTAPDVFEAVRKVLL